MFLHLTRDIRGLITPLSNQIVAHIKNYINIYNGNLALSIFTAWKSYDLLFLLQFKIVVFGEPYQPRDSLLYILQFKIVVLAKIYKLKEFVLI